MGRRLEEFHAIHPPQVRVYTCGPTVYSYAHIGNFRAFIFADTLRRVLEYNGYDVTHVRNITDVGHLTNETLGTGSDKIEVAARTQNVTPWDIAKHYIDAFEREANLLNLKEPGDTPRATDYIEAMISFTERLIDKGHAYEANGNVYYDVSTFPPYGSLSGNTVGDLIEGERVEVGEGKRAGADFALWRAADPEKIMRWPSPWGEGVPGWHIECSVMSMALLGEELDIHTGGEDHIFPHHEDEIAQSEVATERQFSRIWLHNAFLQQPGDEKMSKSLGNFYTVSNLRERGIHPLSYRYFNFQANYRTPLDFTFRAVEAAQTSLFRVWEALAELAQSATPEGLGPEGQELKRRFNERINQDLDMPGAVAVLHEALGSALPPGQKLTLADDFDSVFGLDLISTAEKLSVTTPEQQALLEERAGARGSRDWQKSDVLRKQLNELGLNVKDTPDGQRWMRTDLLANGGRRSLETGN